MGVAVRTTTPVRVVLRLTANTPATAAVAVMTAVARTIAIWRMVLSSHSKHSSPDFFSPQHHAPTATSRHWYLPIRPKNICRVRGALLAADRVLAPQVASDGLVTE